MLVNAKGHNFSPTWLKFVMQAETYKLLVKLLKKEVGKFLNYGRFSNIQKLFCQDNFPPENYTTFHSKLNFVFDSQIYFL